MKQYLKLEERYIIYCILLQELKNAKRLHIGLCDLIYHIFGIHNNGLYRTEHWNAWGKVIFNYFPELNAQDTGERYGGYNFYVSNYWFKNDKERKLALKKAIKLVEIKLKY